jgi:hypothetical protein
VRFDLELERRAGRPQLEQLIEPQRMLIAGSAVGVAQPGREDLRRCALMRPAGHGGAELEQRVVQQHEVAVGGQAAVRLEAVEWLLEGASERRERRVRAVGAAEAVGVQGRVPPANCGGTGALARYQPATVL